jgi:hypothetical protein
MKVNDFLVALVKIGHATKKSFTFILYFVIIQPN